MRTVGLTAQHINIYWDTRYSNTKGSGNKEDATLASIKLEAQHICNDLNVFAHKFYKKDDLDELYQNLKIKLKKLKNEKLSPAIQNALKQSPRDEKYLRILYVIWDDIEATEQHIKEIENETESRQNFWTDFTDYYNGICINNFHQNFNPFFGKEVHGKEGFCSGLVYAWAYKKNTSDALIRQSSTYTSDELRHRLKEDYTTKHTTDKNLDNIYEVILLFEFEQYTTYELTFGKVENGNGHALGMRKCNEIDEYEIFDPNFGIFRFNTQKDAAAFLKTLALHYKKRFDNYHSFFINKINKKYEGEDIKYLENYKSKSVKNDIGVFTNKYKKKKTETQQGPFDDILNASTRALCLELTTNFSYKNKQDNINNINTLINQHIDELSNKHIEVLFNRIDNYRDNFKMQPRLEPLKSWWDERKRGGTRWDEIFEILKKQIIKNKLKNCSEVITDKIMAILNTHRDFFGSGLTETSSMILTDSGYNMRKYVGKEDLTSKPTESLINKNEKPQDSNDEKNNKNSQDNNAKNNSNPNKDPFDFSNRSFK